MKEATRCRLISALKAVAVLLVTVAILVAVALELREMELDNGSQQAIAAVSGNGMPLDAVQYDAPEWMPEAKQVFRVVDRQSGCSWWVIDMTYHNQWLVLPVEGKVQNVG